MTVPAAKLNPTRADDSPVVTTTSGRVRGLRAEHADVFLDIPYAAPPLRPLRFAPPAPHPAWEGTRDGSTPGPNAPQPARNRLGRLDLSPFFGDGWVPGDDYLTVNVWAPADRSTPSPVAVFVHGGAFIAGSTRAPLYNGEAFARDGVVFVAVNYRLGIAGFMHLEDAPDNRGRLDVLAALRWVQRNVARFGGDPGNVTLAGQSAGAILVSSVVGAPDARGLFGRAIVQSGSGSAAFTPGQAARVSAAVGRELGIDPTAATLSRLTDAQTVDLLPELAGLDLRTETDHDPLGGITPFNLVLDRQPVERLAVHGAPGVDLMIGSNQDEAALYLAPFVDLNASSFDDVQSVAALFHPEPDKIVQAYRTAKPSATAGELRTALLGDAMFGVGTRRYARAHADHEAATFVYEFTWRSDALGGHLGACHLMELPFVFDRVDLPALHGPEGILGTTPAPRDLATRVHAAWVRFAACGDPGWSPYRPATPVVQDIRAAQWKTLLDPHAAEFRSWNTAPGRLPGVAVDGLSRPREA